MPRYTIRKNRLNHAYITGLAREEDGSLTLTEAMFHGLVLKGLDSAEDDHSWGRMIFDITRSEDVVLTVYAFAVNRVEYGPEKSNIDELDRLLTEGDDNLSDRIMIMKKQGAKRFVETDDMVLYDLKGRYLYLALELAGEGEAAISTIVIDSVGDTLIGTFPEIYQKRDTFFHRYLSIFSSIFDDFQKEIVNYSDILDLDTCPVEMLIAYGSWMGIDLRGGFLPEEVMRTLVKEAYELNKMKGTRRAMERILEILLGEKAILIEHNTVRKLHKEQIAEMLPGFEARGVYDVTVLVRGKLTEEMESRISFVLNQFKPIRTRISIAQLDENVIIDSNSYLDVNAKIPEEAGVRLDDEAALGGVVILQ